MNSEWKNFLTDAGAEFNNGTVTSFGNPGRERKLSQTGIVFCDLSHYGILAVAGADATTYLQGQTTNDVTQVTLEKSQYGAFCSQKGRAYVNYRLFKIDEAYFLSMPAELIETIAKRLSMFILRSDVTLGNVSDSIMHIGIAGDKADDYLKQATGKIPDEVNGCVQLDSYTIIRVPGEHPRYEIFAELEDMKKLWGTLDVNAAPVGANTWELLNIQAGIPTISTNTSESFVPQMINMDVTEGISFTKGCYTGQEIVARTHYLGKQKKKMFHIHIDTDTPPEPGDELRTAASTDSQIVGNIVNAQLNSDDTVDALAVIQMKDADDETLQLKSNGAAVKKMELPYSLEMEK